MASKLYVSTSDRTDSVTIADIFRRYTQIQETMEGFEKYVNSVFLDDCGFSEYIELTDYYLNAVNNGQEIVIVSNEVTYDSAIIWKSDNKFYSFNRAFGTMERTDWNDDKFINHMEQMESENANIFVRGYTD